MGDKLFCGEEKEEHFIFTMDGSQHTKQEETGCCDDASPCHKCGEPVHRQGAWGCLLERCEGEDCDNGGEHGY